MLSSQFVNSGSGVPNLSGVFGKGASNLATSFQQNPPPPVHTPPPAGNLASHTTSTTNPDGTTNTTTLKYNNSVGTKPGTLNQVKGTTVSASDATPFAPVDASSNTPVNTQPYGPNNPAPNTAYAPTGLVGPQTPPTTVAPSNPVATPSFPNTVQGLIDSTNKNTQLGYQGQQIGDTANSQIQDIYKQAAQGEGLGATGASPIALGRNQLIAQNAGSLAQGIAAGAGQALAGNSQALTGQGQLQSGLTNAASAISPSQASYGQTVFNPATGTYSGGSSGVAKTDPFYATMQQYAQDYVSGQASSIPSSITSNSVLNSQLQQMAKDINPSFNTSTAAANTNSVSDYQTKINDTQSQAASADSNFNILNSYAQAVGGGNTPILQGLQKLYGSTVQGSQAVAGFNSALQTVRQAWSNIIGGDATVAIPDNVTASQITEIQQQLKRTAQNNVAGYQQQMSEITNGGNNSSGTINSTSQSILDKYGIK